VLISAPHSTRHWRSTFWKQEEEYTAALVHVLHTYTGAFGLFARTMIDPDPHDDADRGVYKQVLLALCRAYRVRYVLDLHGARGDRDFAVAIGTIHGQTFGDYEEALIGTFHEYGFTPDAPNSLDRLALNPTRYAGGVRQPTVTRYLWQNGIPTVQLELSAWVRVVERLPNASNAKNGTAPHFRGDPERIERLFNALQTFIVRSE
jgi:hypothetical protein